MARQATMRVCSLLGTLALVGWCVEPLHGEVSFREQIAPILQEHCVACHGAKRAEGGYRLDTVEELVKPGDGGLAPVVPQKSSESEWISRLRAHEPGVRMPDESEPLVPEQIDLIAKWIDEGASLEGIAPKDPLWLVIPPRKTSTAPEHYSRAIPVTAMAFSADGSQLITSGYHEALLWNPSTGELVRRLPNQTQRAYAIQSLPDGRHLAVAGGTPGAIGDLRLIDGASGAVEHVLARSNDVVLDCALRPGHQEIAIALADNTIRLYDLETMQLKRVISSHADWVTQLAYSDDGKRLGSASRDRSAKVYDAATGDLLVSYPGHGAAVRGIAAIGDGAQWVSVGSDRKLHRWELEGAKKIAEVPLGGEPAKLVRVDSSIVVPCSDKHWYRIDLSNNAIGIKVPGHEDWLVSAAYDGATARLATGGLDGSVRIWNVKDGSLIAKWVAKP
ncbi:MAG: c-type cytochrome domain-containing protein [Planctomycetota bacterium]